MTMQPTDREKEISEIILPVTDKLKQIRDKAHPDIYENGEGLGYFTETVEEIQSETYKLGRSEVIDEIEKIVNEAKAKDLKEQFGLNTMVVLSVIQAKLNNLKK